jgi:Integrase core domain
LLCRPRGLYVDGGPVSRWACSRLVTCRAVEHCPLGRRAGPRARHAGLLIMTLKGAYDDHRDDLEIATVEYIDWYNSRRLHGELGHVPPAEYEALHVMTQPVTATLETS